MAVQFSPVSSKALLLIKVLVSCKYRHPLQRERSHGLKMDGLTVLRRFTESKEARVLRRFICQWRDACLKKESQQEFVFQIMQRRKKTF